jgi:hypothetical protein
MIAGTYCHLNINQNRKEQRKGEREVERKKRKELKHL